MQRESLNGEETRQESKQGKIRARAGSGKMRPALLSAKERSQIIICYLKNVFLPDCALKFSFLV